MVSNLGRDFWIIESSQYGFSLVMIRQTCSRLLKELESGLCKVFIRFWWNANSFKSFVVISQLGQLLQDLRPVTNAQKSFEVTESEGLWGVSCDWDKRRSSDQIESLLTSPAAVAVAPKGAVMGIF